MSPMSSTRSATEKTDELLVLGSHDALRTRRSVPLTITPGVDGAG